MADDAATAVQLRAELRELRRSHVAEVAALGDALRTRDRALTGTLEHQAATADILRVIAASSADLTSDHGDVSPTLWQRELLAQRHIIVTMVGARTLAC